MQGAREFSELFRTEQIGRLYIVAGSHARGSTFHIYVLPEGEAALQNGPNNRCLNRNAVEVYGIISGQPGWTESYGWIHRGPWVEDFNKIAKERAEARYAATLAKADALKKAANTEEKRTADLLSTYKSGAA